MFRCCRFYQTFSIFYTLTANQICAIIKFISCNCRCVFTGNYINRKVVCFEACTISICNICDFISRRTVYVINSIFFAIYSCVSDRYLYAVIRLNYHTIRSDNGNIICFIIVQFFSFCFNRIFQNSFNCS